MEFREIGKTKKAIQDNFIKFLKRLNTMTDVWYVCNDIWYPANRTPGTRPGLHCAKCYVAEDIKTGALYRTRPISDICNDIDKAASDNRGVTALYLHDEDGIWVCFGNVQVNVAMPVPIAMTEIPSDALKYRNSTFDEAFDTDSMTPIPQDVLMGLKSGNLAEIEKENVVVTRLVRSMFKLRGKSERINAPIDYKAWYGVNVPLADERENIPDHFKGNLILFEFILVVQYPFVTTAHTYFTIPFAKPESIEDAITMVTEHSKMIDLGLFDESEEDEGYGIVD